MASDKDKIMLLEDDETLGYLLQEYLNMNEFEVYWAKTGDEGWKMLEQHSYDLAILDVMLPDIDGFSFAKKINAINPNLPFLFLTARSLKIDILKGFSLGAVDYLKKPIDEEVLVVRIKALLSRLKNNVETQDDDDAFTLGKYTFDAVNQQLHYKDEVITLTKRESELLHYLVTNKNRICTHKEILNHLWGKNDYFNRKSLNVFITHLRKYLSKDWTIKIENVHNRGFIFKTE